MLGPFAVIADCNLYCIQLFARRGIMGRVPLGDSRNDAFLKPPKFMALSAPSVPDARNAVGNPFSFGHPPLQYNNLTR